MKLHLDVFMNGFMAGLFSDFVYDTFAAAPTGARLGDINVDEGS